MCRMLGCVVFLVGSVGLAAEPGPDPEELGRMLRREAARVSDAVVAVNGGGAASGVVVSKDGWVLTAGHVVSTGDSEKPRKIIFENGEKVDAKIVGWDLTSDLGLLRIVGGKKDWPAVELAERAPDPGAYCFTLAHPSGRLAGRPAQLRLGRVLAKFDEEDPVVLVADCNIQPGDSGGPLFDLEGRLIGIDSSAAGIPGFNQFALIDRYLKGRDRLQAGERWGDRDDGPAREGVLSMALDQEMLGKLSNLMMERLQAGHRPTRRFIQQKHEGGGTVELSPQDVGRAMPLESLAVMRGVDPHIGLDDPVLVKQLPKQCRQAVPPVEIVSGGKTVALACPVGPRRVLTKRSVLLECEKLFVKQGGKKVAVEKVGEDVAWDLVLLEAAAEQDWKSVNWPEDKPAVGAGDVLVARDAAGDLMWNVATDARRPVKKKRSIGPLLDESLISGHRSPYPNVIRHALPLYAADAGTPVHDLAGRFVGMHVARFSRTMGLIIPADLLREQMDAMAVVSREPKKPKPEKVGAVDKEAGFDRALYDRLLAKNYESIPLTVIRGKYYVVCMINEQPVHFLLDTGGQSLILSTAKAKELKLPLEDTEIQDGAVGGSFKRQMGSIESMRIGDLVDINTKVIPVLPFHLVPGDDKRTRGGLLGLDILQQMRAIVDFKNHRLLARLPKSDLDFPAILKKSGYPMGTAFSLKQTGPHQLLKAKIDGTPVKLVVDSGADAFTLDKAFCEKNEIEIEAAKDGNQALGAGGHALEVFYADCKSLEIGNRIKLANFTTPVIDLSHVNGDDPDALNGTFGIDLLKQIGFHYDPSGKKLYLPSEAVGAAEPAPEEPEDTEDEHIY